MPPPPALGLGLGLGEPAPADGGATVPAGFANVGAVPCGVSPPHAMSANPASEAVAAKAAQLERTPMIDVSSSAASRTLDMPLPHEVDHQFHVPELGRGAEVRSRG